MASLLAGLPASSLPQLNSLTTIFPHPFSLMFTCSVSLHQTHICPRATRIAFAWSFQQPGWGQTGREWGVGVSVWIPAKAWIWEHAVSLEGNLREHSEGVEKWEEEKSQ